MRPSATVGIGLLLVAMAALCGGCQQRQAQPPAVLRVAGGDAGGWPRSSPAQEGFDAAALQAATDYARQQQAHVLLVTRHSHLLLEYYAQGFDPQQLVDGGGFAEALVALAAGVAVAQSALPPPPARFDAAPLAAAIAAASGIDYASFLSRNLWQPLNAAAAQFLLAAPEAPPSAGCCLAARAGDWLRVAGLLLGDGRFEGTQVVPAGWVARLLRADRDDPGRGYGVQLASSATGAEPFAADGVFFLRGPGQTRLWLVPGLDLAVLLVADAGATLRADETRLPNLVIRALRERPAHAGATLDELVPGH